MNVTKIAAVLTEHQLKFRGLTDWTADRCVCGEQVWPETGDRDWLERRADSFANHQAAMVVAALHHP